jgi:hypothetical protein
MASSAGCLKRLKKEIGMLGKEADPEILLIPNTVCAAFTPEIVRTAYSDCGFSSLSPLMLGEYKTLDSIYKRTS